VAIKLRLVNDHFLNIYVIAIEADIIIISMRIIFGVGFEPLGYTWRVFKCFHFKMSQEYNPQIILFEAPKTPQIKP
jgi:predicted membrane protein